MRLNNSLKETRFNIGERVCLEYDYWDKVSPYSESKGIPYKDVAGFTVEKAYLVQLMAEEEIWYTLSTTDENFQQRCHISEFEMSEMKVIEKLRENKAMRKNIIFLKDMSEGCVDAVILTETTTADEIESIIQEVKDKYESDYCWENLVEALPDDCELIYKDKIETAYY